MNWRGLIKPGGNFMPSLVIGLHLFFLVSAILNQSYLIDDSFHYLTISNNLSATGVFSQSLQLPLDPDLQRTPGYPVFLLLLGNIPILVLFVQHLLVFISGTVFYRALRFQFSEESSRLGGWAFLLLPYPIVLSSVILSETLFLFFLVLSFYFLTRFVNRKDHLSVALCFIMLVAACYIRPLGTVLIIPFLLWVIIVSFRNKNFLSPILAVLFLGLLFPWYYRNHSLSGRWIFTSMGDLGMVYGRMGGMLAEKRGMPATDESWFAAADSFGTEEIGEGKIKTWIGKARVQETELSTPEMRALASKYLLNHPVDFALFSIKSCWRMMLGTANGWSQKVSGSKVFSFFLSGWAMILTVLLYGTVLFSLINPRKNFRMILFPLLCMLLIFAASATAWADGRYRMPADFFAIIVFVGMVERKEVKG